MIRKLLPFLLLALALAGCQDTSVPRFEKGDCPFEVPSDEAVQCGMLVVPEVRPAASSAGGAADALQATPPPDGKTLRLAVAIFKSKSSSPAPDPIVYLEGGPGGSTLRGWMDQFSLVFDPFLAQRDLILFDQRGTGYSQPALDCPELTREALAELPLDLTTAQSDQRSAQALQACHDRLLKEGANLAAYNSAESAADLSDLRAVLGYKQWNLYGISYGTRLALTVLRDHPQGVRSLVIDGIVPLQASLSNGAALQSAARSLDLLFSGCAADPACAAAFPDLKQVFFNTVKKLDAAPATIKVTLPDMGLPGQSGQQADALINGRSLISITFQALYATSILPSLPQMLYLAGQGQLGPLAELSGQMLTTYRDISYGMNTSVNCAEDVPFYDLAADTAATQAHPELENALGTTAGQLAQCKLWGVPPTPPLEDQPVKSDIPTLVLSGQFDPITPPDLGQQAAATLSRSTFIEIPAAGHGSSLTEPCPRRLALSFIDDPTTPPDQACLKNMKLTFAVPVQKVTVEMAPFSNSLMGISGTAPANWRTISGLPGSYSPTGDLNDSTQLMINGLPTTAAELFTMMSDNLKKQGVTLTPTGEKRANPDLTFTLYTAGGGMVKVDMALAEKNGKSYLVLMQSALGERDALYNAVFLPAIDALKPSK